MQGREPICLSLWSWNVSLCFFHLCRWGHHSPLPFGSQVWKLDLVTLHHFCLQNRVVTPTEVKFCCSFLPIVQPCCLVWSHICVLARGWFSRIATDVISSNSPPDSQGHGCVERIQKMRSCVHTLSAGWTCCVCVVVCALLSCGWGWYWEPDRCSVGVRRFHLSSCWVSKRMLSASL